MEVSCIMAKVISVVSGKGGTGKTTVSVNLACALKIAGYKVLLSDCSFGIRNADIPLGQTHEGLYNISDVISGDVSEDDAIVKNKDHRPDFIFASPTLCPPCFEQAYSGLILRVREKYDYIIIDTPSSSGREFNLCTGLSDIILAVTGEDYLSVSNTALCLNVLDLSGKEVYCIINRASFEETQEGLSAEAIADETGCIVIGIIQEDVHIKKSLEDGDPIIRYNTYGARELTNIAKRICKKYVSPESESIGQRMFDKNRKTLKNN